jgi:hypothetical protein
VLKSVPFAVFFRQFTMATAPTVFISTVDSTPLNTTLLCAMMHLLDPWSHNPKHNERSIITRQYEYHDEICI